MGYNYKKILEFRIQNFVLCILLCGLSFLPQLKAERLNTPDGEAVIRKEVFTQDLIQYRITTTQNTVYTSKYWTGIGWSSNKQLYMVPAGRRIIDFTLKDAPSIGKKLVNLLLDDASVLSFTYNSATQTFEGNSSYEPPLTGGAMGSSPKKLLFSDALYMLHGTRLYADKKDGNAWILDSNGLKGNTINDITFDGKKNILAATNKGLYLLTAGSSTFTRIKGMDSSLNCSSVFFERNGNIYVGTSTRGPWFSTNNGTDFTRDTTGMGNLSISHFGDDVFGNMYAVYSRGTSNLYRKLKDSAAWERIDSNLRNFIGSSLVINDIGGDSTVEAATGYGMYSTLNYGTEWLNTTKGIMSEQIYGLQFLEDEKKVCSTGFGIYTQASNQSDWIKRYPETGFVSGRLLQKDKSDDLYTQELASGYNQTTQPNILKSTDGGYSWELDTVGLSKVPVSGSFFGTVFYVDEQKNQHFGLTSSGSQTTRIYTKTSPTTWEPDTTGTNFPKPSQSQTNIFMIFGSDAKNTLYFSTLLFKGQSYSTANLYKRPMESTDWALDTVGFSGLAVSALCRDTSGRMFAGTLAQGNLSNIYIRDTESWKQIKVPPAATTDVKNLAFDSSGALYVNYSPYFGGTYRGIYRTSDLGETWEYSGFDSVTVRGLVGNEDFMYAYTSRGAYKLTSAPLKIPKLLLSLKIIDYKTVQGGAYKDTTVKISNPGTDTLRITNITSTNAAIAAQTKVLNIAPGFYKDIKIRFTPQSNGVVNGTLRFVSNAFPDSINVIGEGFGFKYPNMILSQKIIDFGKVIGGNFKDTTVTIMNNGDDTLKITNIRSYLPAFSCSSSSFSILPGDSGILQLRFTPTVNGTVNTSIRFTGNMPADTLFVVGEGTELKIPQLQLSLNSINFGIVELGTKKDTNLTIRNIGLDTLIITSIHSNMTSFGVSAISAIIPPEDSMDLVITYIPASHNQENGIITFAGNSKPDSAVNLSVTGRGKDPLSVEDNIMINGLIFDIQPNPSMVYADLHVKIPVDCNLSLKLYDIFGDEVASIINNKYPVGDYIFNINLGLEPYIKLSDGIYFCKIVADTYSKTKLLIIER
jgi:hypothetical protein